MTIEAKVNKECNLAIYLSSGKRLYLDLNNQTIRSIVMH